ncbi:helix-turn-helix domain-containing protein [Amycolatopsis taiwanensis]|uniref:helix-turn-helix domain-containing protein n=1 Tax=Amycolatopsis taiwanensis TaxID=342230 RepID=UPI0004863A1F|nr:helix-turn-helix domain-containing protein [Amycolatopsis taiwanensis]
MDDDQIAATVAQLKALGHPLRLRILRLCLERDHTNQELAAGLDVAPATALRHVRELVATGFLDSGEMRTGDSGAWERPYRATRLSRRLAVHHVGHPDLSRDVQLAVVAAYHAELAASDLGVVRSQERLAMRLSESTLRELINKVEALLREYVQRDDPDGVGVSVLWSLHERENGDQ